MHGPEPGRPQDPRAAPPEVANGLVRRLGLALLHHRLFGAPLPHLGRFVIQAKLGEGGMGAVFEALDPELGRVVALKVMRDQIARDRDITHVARMLARLRHPNVVVVHELGREGDDGYVCMERVDGPDLATWLGAHPEAPWRTRCQHMLGAARGLAAAHRAGMVHRDFKLENVLLGADGVPRVTDFGLARSGEEPGVDGRSAPSLAGTPGYLAPEVLRGQPATPASDQYSFFVALRTALQGVQGTEPAALARLIHAGTHTDPAARLPSMDAVVEALEAQLERRASPDQRARDVLCERVQGLWVTPLRRRAAAPELYLEATPAPELCPDRALHIADGGPEAIAGALHTLLAGTVLVGGAGAGKSTRLLDVASVMLERCRDNPEATLPVVLNLSSFHGFSGSLEEWLQHELVSKYALPRQTVARWLGEGQLALLLDGLDELAAGDRVRLVEALNALRERRPLPYLVTCREENYGALRPRLACDLALRLSPLDAALVAPTLRRMGAPEAAATLAASDPALGEQLRNPLLLSIFGEVAGEMGGSPEPGDLRGALYAAALRHALQRPPALEPTEAERLKAGLIWLAGVMEKAGVTELWLEEIQAGWLPERRQRALALGMGLGAAYALSIGLNLAAAHFAQLPWYSGLFFGIIAVTAAFFIQGGVKVAPMEAMRWSWPRVRTWIPRNIALGVLTGGLHGLIFDFWADLILGVATGLLGLSVIGLVPSGRERRVNPGDGLLESLRNSLMVAPLIGLIIGLPVGYLVLPLTRPLASPDSMVHTHPDPGLAWALSMGTSAAVTSLFITGFLAPLLHAAIRLTLAWTTPLPLALPAWLDAAQARGLLVRVGGGWQFRHATFRAWMAALPPGT